MTRSPLRALLLLLLTCTSLCAACRDEPTAPDGDMSGSRDMSPDLDTPDQPAELDLSEALDLADDLGPAADSSPDLPPMREGATLLFEPTSEDFFALPLPSDARRDAQGKIHLSDWTRAAGNSILSLWLAAADELVEGFSPVAGFFLTFDAAIDPASLPTLAQSTLTEPEWPSIFLIDVDAQSPERGKRFPLECNFNLEAGRWRVANQVACVPPWGVMRREETQYAVVVTRALHDAEGAPVKNAAALEALMRGESVEGRRATISGAAHVEALDYVVGTGLAREQIVALDVFTTWSPTARLRQVNTFYKALPEPTIDAAKGLKVVRDHGEYVVVEGYYEVPIIQDGALPYDAPPSGKIHFDAQGEIAQVDTQLIRFYITLPRQPMPGDGYPVLLYLHGSGGVAEQLLDRGPYAPNGAPPAPGNGPARVIAPYGIAGFAADFQLHGMRFDPPDTSGLKLYNLFGNPRGTIDNFLVAANEVTLHARLLAGLEIDPQQIEGLTVADFDLSASPDGKIRFDDARFVTMGQSMGSTIGLPAATIDTVTDGTILSGSGGVLVEIATTSTQPAEIAPLLKTLLRYKEGEALDRFDPMLHVLQHVWDIVDPMTYARHLFLEPFAGIPAKHVLQHSGLTDGYFSPDARAGLSAAMGVELVNPVLEPRALEIMGWVGKGAIDAPARGNDPSGVTAVVKQYEPSVLDGHNVAYQRDDAKAQYACFVKSLRADRAPLFAPVAQASPQQCDAE